MIVEVARAQIRYVEALDKRGGRQKRLRVKKAVPGFPTMSLDHSNEVKAVSKP